MEGKNNLAVTKTQGKGAVTPQETETDLPVSVLESPAEVRVDSGLRLGQRHWQQQSWEVQHVGIIPLRRSCHYPYHRACRPTIETADSSNGPSQAKLLGGGTATPISRQLG